MEQKYRKTGDKARLSYRSNNNPLKLATGNETKDMFIAGMIAGVRNPKLIENVDHVAEAFAERFEKIVTRHNQ